MKNAAHQIEEEILFVSQQLNDELYEQYSSGEITLQRLEEAYRILAQWSIQSEKVLKLIE